ncbi:hypothetical protein EYF80_040632 [Liparis tanakae]|uniref:Uncharacterized protein n=1 Tax=Liparis tanakae TaxID=230148 RepID=A0A4Z2G6K7_9TELE|nr:hypothetical protein EYF80_040632 [Liparis tanakae]
MAVTRGLPVGVIMGSLHGGFEDESIRPNGLQRGGLRAAVGVAALILHLSHGFHSKTVVYDGDVSHAAGAISIESSRTECNAVSPEQAGQPEQPEQSVQPVQPVQPEQLQRGERRERTGHFTLNCMNASLAWLTVSVDHELLFMNLPSGAMAMLSQAEHLTSLLLLEVLSDSSPK